MCPPHHHLGRHISSLGPPTCDPAPRRPENTYGLAPTSLSKVIEWI